MWIISEIGNFAFAIQKKCHREQLFQRMCRADCCAFIINKKSLSGLNNNGASKIYISKDYKFAPSVYSIFANVVR